MGIIAHIDSRGVRMDHLQTRILRLQPRASSFLALRFRNSFLSVLIPVLLAENRDSVRPGDEWFRNLPNGVKGPLHRGPCHHASDRQYRGHACGRARSTSEFFGLSLPNRIRIRLAKTESSRQVSRASVEDAIYACGEDAQSVGQTPSGQSSSCIVITLVTAANASVCVLTDFKSFPTSKPLIPLQINRLRQLHAIFPGQ
jgi:hypothetical protein